MFAIRCLLKVELDFENESIFKCYPLVVLPLICSTFHFHYFRGESRLNNVYFYNDNNVTQKAE